MNHMILCQIYLLVTFCVLEKCYAGNNSIQYHAVAISLQIQDVTKPFSNEISEKIAPREITSSYSTSQTETTENETNLPNENSTTREAVSPTAIFLSPTYSTTIIPSPQTCPTETIYDINHRGLTFPETEKGSWTTAEQLCLHDNYTPIIRYCSPFDGWSLADGNCSNVRITETTASLNTTLFETDSIRAVEAATRISENIQTWKAIDVYLVAKIIEKFWGYNNNPDDFFTIVNNVLDVNRRELVQSQNLLNSTDTILYTLENLIPQTYWNIRLSGVLVLTIYHYNIGVMIKRNTQNKSFDIIYLNQTNLLHYLENSDFEIAVITMSTFSYDIILFKNDNLFNGYQDVVNGWIIYTSNGYRQMNFKGKIYFKQPQHDFHFCGHWEYGKDENNIPIKGRWRDNDKAKKFKDGFYGCEVASRRYTGLISKTVTYPKTCAQETIKYHNLTFPETEAGSWTTPLQLCLKENYSPVMRYCSIYGTWNSTEEIACSNQVTLTNTTETLHKTMSETNVTAAISVANEITDNRQDEIKAIDVHLISKILERASKDEIVFKNPDKFIGVVNNLLYVKKQELSLSQKLLNSTDTILYSLDYLLLNTDNIHLAVPKVLVYTVNTTTKTMGVMIKSNKESKNFTAFDVISLYEEDYLDQLNNTEFEIAFVIPQSLVSARDYYFITLFRNDKLFNQEDKININSWIISILIPGVKHTHSTIKIYFKEFENNLYQECQHWKYGKDKNNLPIKGRWSSDGNAKKFKYGVYVCEVDHTTHFGMFLSDKIADSFILDLITKVGMVLSVIGIVVIVLTAVIFKQARDNKANKKIIINICCCWIFLIILFYMTDKVGEGVYCIITGILLHYMVLVMSCWSLTISVTSYRRFKMICHDHVAHVVMKSCVFSWGVPFIIVTATAILHYETYDKKFGTSSKICYPKNNYLKFAVCTPIMVVLTINLIVYILIMKSLFFGNQNIRRNVSKNSHQKKKLMILLFFMLGLPWIFGVIGLYKDDFMYLFCIVSPWQGAVMCIFFVFISAEVRMLWKKKLNISKSKLKVETATYVTQTF